MPYIGYDARSRLDPMLEDLLDQLLTEGELNYVITRLIHTYLNDNGEDYSAYNAAVGILECAKLELYRRQIANYEDVKIKQNGDL